MTDTAPSTETRLNHIDPAGNARMVDVGMKPETARVAVASGTVTMSATTLDLVTSGRAAKGDVLGIARTAGIMAAKRTAELVPLCHPIGIDKAAVDVTPAPPDQIVITAIVAVTGRTGVEMEALTAVSVAALTIYDMCKAVDKAIVIGNIQLEEKSGGRTGHYRRAHEEGTAP